MGKREGMPVVRPLAKKLLIGTVLSRHLADVVRLSN